MRKLFAGLALFLAACAPVAEADNGARPYVRALVAERGIFCSAVVLRPGLLLTAQHCMDGETDVRLAPGGTVATVVVAGDLRLFDLSLLVFPAAEAPCPCARIAASEAALDEPVVIVGYPRGITQVVTLGTSQGVVNNDALPYGGPRLVTTAQAAGGNSGGGVFALRNGEYQLVGILVEGMDHLAFAIPVSSIQQFLYPAP